MSLDRKDAQRRLGSIATDALVTREHLAILQGRTVDQSSELVSLLSSIAGADVER